MTRSRRRTSSFVSKTILGQDETRALLPLPAALMQKYLHPSKAHAPVGCRSFSFDEGFQIVKVQSTNLPGEREKREERGQTKRSILRSITTRRRGVRTEEQRGRDGIAIAIFCSSASRKWESRPRPGLRWRKNASFWRLASLRTAFSHEGTEVRVRRER